MNHDSKGLIAEIAFALSLQPWPRCHAMFLHSSLWEVAKVCWISCCWNLQQVPLILVCRFWQILYFLHVSFSFSFIFVLLWGMGLAGQQPTIPPLMDELPLFQEAVSIMIDTGWHLWIVFVCSIRDAKTCWKKGGFLRYSWQECAYPGDKIRDFNAPCPSPKHSVVHGRDSARWFRYTTAMQPI